MLSGTVLKTGRLALGGSNMAVLCYSLFSLQTQTSLGEILYSPNLRKEDAENYRVFVGQFPPQPCQAQDYQSELQLCAAECKL